MLKIGKTTKGTSDYLQYNFAVAHLLKLVHFLFQALMIVTLTQISIQLKVMLIQMIVVLLAVKMKAIYLCPDQNVLLAMEM